MLSNDITANHVLIYSGFWLGNMKHGEGKEGLTDGTIYHGKFDKGERTGIGKLLLNGRLIFKGNW